MSEENEVVEEETPEVEEIPEVEEAAETVEAVEEVEEPNPEIAGLKNAAAVERKKRQIAERESNEMREQLRQYTEQAEAQKAGITDAPPIDTRQAVRAELSAYEREKRTQEWQASMPQRDDVDLNAAVEDIGLALGAHGQSGIEIADDIMASEQSWEILAHIQKNPEVLNKLRSSPIQAAKEITRIEDSLSKPKEKKLSNAPDPITPIDGGAVDDNMDTDNMSLSEYEDWVMKRRGGSVFPDLYRE